MGGERSGEGSSCWIMKTLCTMVGNLSLSLKMLRPLEQFRMRIVSAGGRKDRLKADKT
jgi:hypothetical protein